MAEAAGEAVDLNGIEADQADITEGGSEFARVVELFAAVGGHGSGEVEEHAHGDVGFHLEHFEEHLFEAEIGAPVDGAEVVAMVEVAVVEEFLAGSGEMGRVVAAHQAGKRLLPVDGEAFEFFQEFPV